METSSLSTMKESNGTMAATTHVPARTDLPDIMNAFHRKFLRQNCQKKINRNLSTIKSCEKD